MMLRKAVTYYGKRRKIISPSGKKHKSNWLDKRREGR